MALSTGTMTCHLLMLENFYGLSLMRSYSDECFLMEDNGLYWRPPESCVNHPQGRRRRGAQVRLPSEPVERPLTTVLVNCLVISTFFRGHANSLL